MSNDSNKGYRFNISSGTVTAAYEIKNGRSKLEKMDHDETWSVQGADVVKSEWEHGRLETTLFSDADGDGIFSKVSKSYGTETTTTPAVTPSPLAPAAVRDGYQFDVQDGQVIAVYEVERGLLSPKRIDPNEAWTLDGANIVKTELEHSLVETSVYADSDGDGIFSKISKTYTTTDGTQWTGQSGTDSDDLWKGNNRDDHYYAGNGHDRLSGGLGNDDLYGADGDDQLSGDTGSDDLYGGVGNDCLTGGSGSDDLYGGDGNDTFKLTSVQDSGPSSISRDHVHDFASGDKIDLSGIDAKVGNWTNDAFTFVGNAANLTLANANGAVWFENGILYGSNDKDLAAEFQIELVGVTAISAAALVL